MEFKMCVPHLSFLLYVFMLMLLLYILPPTLSSSPFVFQHTLTLQALTQPGL